MAPRETENNAYAKFWGDKQRALWYVMVFLEWSITFFIYLCVSLYQDFFFKKRLREFVPAIMAKFKQIL